MKGLRGLTVAAAMASVVLAAPAASAAPVPRADYVGTAPGAERPSFVRIARDGRHLARYLFAVRLSCSDGVSRNFGLDEFREKRFGLAADGRFDHRSAPNRFSVGRGRSKITGRGSTRVTGQFSTDRATMRVVYRFEGRTSCGGDVPLTMTRVGSPGLSPRGVSLFSGTYRRLKDSDYTGLRISPFKGIGPALVVDDLTVGWTAERCTRRFRYRDSYPFVPLLLEPGGLLNLVVRDSYRFPGGYRVRLKARLTLDFEREVYLGTWAATSRLYRRGRHVSTCRFPRRHFSGTHESLR